MQCFVHQACCSLGNMLRLKTAWLNQVWPQPEREAAAAAAGGTVRVCGVAMKRGGQALSYMPNLPSQRPRESSAE